MNYKPAKELADKFLALLAPACESIEIVGSVKRCDYKSLANGVHDLEFLLIPKPGRPPVQFGQKQIFQTHLDKLLFDLQQEGIIRQALDKKDGPKYKKRAISLGMNMNEFCMDLFIVTPATWGLHNLIRTGPSWFSHRAVTNKKTLAWNRETGQKMHGFLPDDLCYVKGSETESGESCIMCGGGVLAIPEEAAVFDLIFGHWIDPSQRREFAEKE